MFLYYKKYFFQPYTLYSVIEAGIKISPNQSCQSDQLKLIKIFFIRAKSYVDS